MLVLLLAVNRSEVAAPRDGSLLVPLPVHLLLVEVVLGGLAGQQRRGDRVAHHQPLLLDQPQRNARGRRLGQREEHVSRHRLRLDFCIVAAQLADEGRARILIDRRGRRRRLGHQLEQLRLALVALGQQQRAQLVADLNAERLDQLERGGRALGRHGGGDHRGRRDRRLDGGVLGAEGHDQRRARRVEHERAQQLRVVGQERIAHALVDRHAEGRLEEPRGGLRGRRLECQKERLRRGDRRLDRVILGAEGLEQRRERRGEHERVEGARAEAVGLDPKEVVLLVPVPDAVLALDAHLLELARHVLAPAFPHVLPTRRLPLTVVELVLVPALGRGVVVGGKDLALEIARAGLELSSAPRSLRGEEEASRAALLVVPAADAQHRTRNVVELQRRDVALALVDLLLLFVVEAGGDPVVDVELGRELAARRREMFRRRLNCSGVGLREALHGDLQMFAETRLGFSLGGEREHALDRHHKIRGHLSGSRL